MNIFKNNEISFKEIERGVKRKVLANSVDMMLVQVKFETGSKGKVHTHPHQQIAYVSHGVFEFEVEDEKILLGKGDSIVIKSEQKHGVNCIEQGEILDVFTPPRLDFIDIKKPLT